MPKKTEIVCPKCGKAMVERNGKSGTFLGCSGYPKCRNLVEVDAQGNPVKPFDTGLKCEKCGGSMGIKKSWRGPFLGCNNYPKCRSTMKLTDELKEKFKDHLPPTPPKKPEIKVEGIEPCPVCGAVMKVRTGRGGNYFLGCTKYPKCRTTAEPSPELLEKIIDAAEVDLVVIGTPIDLRRVITISKPAVRVRYDLEVLPGSPTLSDVLAPVLGG